ncbi:acyl-CoA carboxylase subunit epsilon [Rhodococcus sp. NPDC058532]|uniref:acyl-CoA carboxylase subunit epsilon n=1 Tax=Rhodococcus sp. NPDC058532 TaxID=3346540 RepID=UPI003664ADA4
MTALLESADVAVALDEVAMLGASAPQQDPIRFAGNPTDEEVAAVLAVFSALGSVPTAEEPRSEETWGAPAQLMRYGLSVAPTTFVNARFAR